MATAAVNVSLSFDAELGKPGARTRVVAANVARPDLCGPLGSCDHGFTATMPLGLKDGKPHALYAYAMDPTGDQLSRGERSVARRVAPDPRKDEGGGDRGDGAGAGFSCDAVRGRREQRWRGLRHGRRPRDAAGGPGDVGGTGAAGTGAAGGPEGGGGDPTVSGGSSATGASSSGCAIGHSARGADGAWLTALGAALVMAQRRRRRGRRA